MNRSYAGSRSLCGVCCAIVLALSQSDTANAQEPANRSLPPCDSAAPTSFPCRTPFDQPPVVQKQPALPDTGPRRAPWVWMFVTDKGTVAAAQIERGAGLDFDIAAIRRARRSEFTPAQLNGSPVPAWILLAVETTPEPEGCPTMAVPVSAGVAIFVDSENLARPELGTLYRYLSLDSLPLDVFVYPDSAWPSPGGQVRDFITALDVMRDRGDFLSYEVQKQGELKIKVSGGRPRRDITLTGAVARVLLTVPDGTKPTTYYAVFPEGEKYVKFRATYRSDRSVQGTVDEFIRQVLSARASTPAHCSR